jgi:hypothetical protein
MKSKNRQRNVQQHFVTASYLAGFTHDGNRDSQLYVYERNTERMFRVIPDEAAKRRNYYSIPTSTGLNDQVDVMITALEGQAMPSLRKLLLKDYNLSTFERALLAFLIAFQEFRTPWARANFQKMEVSLTEHLTHSAANAPGYLEQIFKQLEAEGKADGSVSPNQLRNALRDERIKLVAQPHAGIDLMVSTSQAIGNIYTQMRWTVLHAMEGEFLTSDAPVVRRDPGFKGGFYGGGLISSTAEVWFPLSKSVCLLIRHDEEKMKKFGDLLEARKLKEAEALKADLPPIDESEIELRLVDAVNSQTILSADRFVFSPFESERIPQLFKGDSHNLRIVVSPPLSRRERTK